MKKSREKRTEPKECSTDRREENRVRRQKKRKDQEGREGKGKERDECHENSLKCQFASSYLNPNPKQERRLKSEYDNAVQ